MNVLKVTNWFIVLSHLLHFINIFISKWSFHSHEPTSIHIRTFLTLLFLYLLTLELQHIFNPLVVILCF